MLTEEKTVPATLPTPQSPIVGFLSPTGFEPVSRT